MGLVEILLLAVGLAMDAFAVSICKGLSMKKNELEKSNYHCFLFWRVPSYNACIGLFFRHNL